MKESIYCSKTVAWNMIPDDEEEDATLALHRQKHVEEKKQNEKNRKDLGKKMIAIKNAMKVFKSDQKKIEEQMIAVEERVEQSESEAEKQELEKLHKDLSISASNFDCFQPLSATCWSA